MTNFSYYTNKIEAQMKAELKAVKYFITVLEKLKDQKELFKKFDKKVVNKRFIDSLQESLNIHCSLDTFLNNTNLVYRTNEPLHFKDNCYYPQQYRELNILLDIEDKRLNSEKTLKNINDKLEYLKTEINKYTYNEKEITAKFEEVEKLDNQLKAIFNDCNWIVSEQLRKGHMYIR